MKNRLMYTTQQQQLAKQQAADAQRTGNVCERKLFGFSHKHARIHILINTTIYFAEILSYILPLCVCSRWNESDRSVS